MKKTKFVLTTLLLAVFVAVFALAGCEKTFNKDDSVADLSLEVGADYITVKGCEYPDGKNRATEFKLGNGVWQQKDYDGTSYITYNNLTPNTLYTVYARAIRYGNEPFSKTVNTLKRGKDAPQGISYRQADNTVTLTGISDGMEFCYEGGVWSTEDTHTFADTGEKVILIRYKETDTDKASAEFSVSVLISEFYGGRGTEAEPFLINSLEQFMAMDNYNVSTLTDSSGKWFKLVSDIEFGDRTVTKPFSCFSFDGNGKSLINPKIQITKNHGQTNVNYVALFSNVAVIKNVTVVNAVLDIDVSTVSPDIALLAARAANVTNCHVSGEINIKNQIAADPSTGGLVSDIYKNERTTAECLVDLCSADVVIKYVSQNNANGMLRVGGLLGTVLNDKPVTVTKSYADAEIELLGTYGGYVGGLAGEAKNTDFFDCYATGSIATDGDTGANTTSILRVGGFVGQASIGSIQNCYAAIDIGSNGTNQNVYIGGIASMFSGTGNQSISNCFFAGNISLTAGTRIYLRDSLTSSAVVNYSVTNCYHSDNLTSPVGTSKTTSASSALMKTVDWQKNTLRFGGGVWDFTEGAFPELKK